MVLATDGKQDMKKVLIAGATSAMAKHCARYLAEVGCSLFLCARNGDALNELEQDLTGRGASQTGSAVLDMNHHDQHEVVLEQAKECLGGLDMVLLAHGTLPDQTDCEKSVSEMLASFNTNALSAIAFITLAANFFEQQGQGTIAAISSVAGDRGRKSNYVYGAAKGCLSLYLQGLRNRFGKTAIRVVTIKPGLVISPMTEDFEKGALWADADSVGRSIGHIMLEGKQDIVYLPGFWRWIMLIIGIIPERLFKRLSIG